MSWEGQEQWLDSLYSELVDYHLDKGWSEAEAHRRAEKDLQRKLETGDYPQIDHGDYEV